MSLPKIEITLRDANQEIDRLKSYRTESSNLEAKFQYFIAEMIMIRLFSLFELTVSEIAFKLASGASYINNRVPVLQFPKAKSMAGARSLLLTAGRSKPVQNLKWTKAKYINQNVQKVFQNNEPFIKNALLHGEEINEMRIIRNTLGHSNKSCKAEYKGVVQKIYGANLRIKPGAFLTSTQRQTMCNLDRYLGNTKVIISDLGSGQ